MAESKSPTFLAPSADEYTRALRELESEFSQTQTDLLRAHYVAPQYTVTWQQLAEAVGYSSGNAVNLHYGTLAKRIADKLGITEPPEGFWLHVLADWAPQVGPSGHTAFQLRPSFVDALGQFGWSPGLTPPSLLDTDDSALEGRRSLQLVAHRHREAKLRHRRIELARGESPDGKLRCSVAGCGFCFEDAYGEQASDYIQVHHTKPLSDSERGERTHVSELALVCANCHAMLHYLEPARTLETLRMHRAHEV